jgi:hypothetical protein
MVKSGLHDWTCQTLTPGRRDLSIRGSTFKGKTFK